MDLLQFINLKSSLPSQIETQLVKALTTECFTKNQIILAPDNNSKKIYFVEHGLARIFYLKDDKDITLHFLPENSFALPFDSIFFNQVCRYGIQALDGCEVRSMYYSIWENLLLESPELEKLSRHLMVGYVKKTTDRVYHLQFQTANERFESMMETYPDILQRAPSAHVATYLGITTEALGNLYGTNVDN